MYELGVESSIHLPEFKQGKYEQMFRLMSHLDPAKPALHSHINLLVRLFDLHEPFDEQFVRQPIMS